MEAGKRKRKNGKKKKWEMEYGKYKMGKLKKGKREY